MKLVIASRNSGKIKELISLLAPLKIKVVSVAEYPNVPEIIEDGANFAENAVKKAKTVAIATDCLSMGDDSGLEVDYLNGAPGTYSARFAGEESNDKANNDKLLRLLDGVPWEKRTARFCCVIAIATPSGQVFTASGRCEGLIAFEPKGEEGFGYDPLFFVPRLGKTFSEMEPALKNSLSHRSRALSGASLILMRLMKEEYLT